jgi:hypothetical protein
VAAAFTGAKLLPSAASREYYLLPFQHLSLIKKPSPQTLQPFWVQGGCRQKIPVLPNAAFLCWMLRR